jgi:hypothetical protein
MFYLCDVRRECPTLISTPPFIAPNGKKIFGTVDTPVDFLEALGNDKTLQRTLSALSRVPMRFYRDNLIAGEGDAAEHIFFVVRGGRPQLQNFQTRCPQHRRLLSAR